MNRSTLKTNRIHIGFFGLRNSGKSALINKLADQEVSIVSPTPGTTTDPVLKTMEILPMGPVVLIDTPGIDDGGELGKLRVRKTLDFLDRVHMGVLVVDCTRGISSYDLKLGELLNKKEIPWLLVLNKADLADEAARKRIRGEISRAFGGRLKPDPLLISAKSGENIGALSDALSSLVPTESKSFMISDLISPGDIVVNVIKIDESAPKDRIILPQQMLLRDILDRGALGLVLGLDKLEEAMASLNKKPRLVITDSQLFGLIDRMLDQAVPLTSYSIIMARYKGDLDSFIDGVKVLDRLEKGKILIAEACSHRRNCDDIGTVQLPGRIREYTGRADIDFDFTHGGSFPDDLSGYDLMIHCGGCMLNNKEIKARLDRAGEKDLPVTNYGVALAYMNGILDRATAFFRR
jgi:[FeFe] hydrogenase H-cluster maturation GTPase HydF